ncbi:RNA pyrophosphohydrolase [Leptospira ellisii]|nr:RNA pyrophosphohydrolase [Leptospira ellisii]
MRTREPRYPKHRGSGPRAPADPPAYYKPEDPEKAALRELYEEVGVDSGITVSEYPDWIAYDFPDNLPLNRNLQKYKGQLQKWYLIYWNGSAEDCDLETHEREFETVRFIPIEKTLETIVSFKKDVYNKIVKYFGPKIRSYLNGTGTTR